MNTKSGMARLDGGDHGRPVVVVGPRPAALAPGPLEDVVHHQHRHVAADAVALRGDRAERLDHGRPQVGRERVQLHDVRPGREVRVAAVREHAAADAHERRRIAREVVVAPADEVLGVRRPSTGGRARRGSARSRGSAPPRARRAPRARPRARRAAEVRVDRVVADAVRRADDVLGREVGQRAPEALDQARRSRARSRSPPGCAPRRPSARPRRSRAPRSRPTRSRARWRGRSRRPRGGSARRARPTC